MLYNITGPLLKVVAAHSCTLSGHRKKKQPNLPGQTLPKLLFYSGFRAKLGFAGQNPKNGDALFRPTSGKLEPHFRTRMRTQIARAQKETKIARQVPIQPRHQNQIQHTTKPSRLTTHEKMMNPNSIKDKYQTINNLQWEQEQQADNKKTTYHKRLQEPHITKKLKSSWTQQNRNKRTYELTTRDSKDKALTAEQQHETNHSDNHQ